MQQILKTNSRWARFKNLFRQGHFDIYISETKEEQSPGVLLLNVHLTGDITIHIFPKALAYPKAKLLGYYQQASTQLHEVLGLLLWVNKLVLSLISLPFLVDFYWYYLQDMVNAGFAFDVVLEELRSLVGSLKSIGYYLWFALLFFGKRLLGYVLRKRLGL